ncbi:unnamed protein product [Nezara viridula]|uniref:Uncharacterized protein n=1 Tax=Nezara viridula TaxID=85310 RepID=A0A9P0H275_NEZVI|nr:unnamed protein product [Nezara viridula]
MAKILRHFCGAIKRIRTRTITANINENEEMREKWVHTFINNNRQIVGNGIVWNTILRENLFLTKPIDPQNFLQNNHHVVPKVYWSFSFKDIVGQLWKKKKGNASTCGETKKKKKIPKPKCAKKKTKKKCSKTKKTCLDPKKKKDNKEAKNEDPCKAIAEKKVDPCKKKEDPCAEIKAKKADPGKKTKDPCKEKIDPCKKYEDPCKNADPCAKYAEKKDDPCKSLKEKIAAHSAKKEDPCKKNEDPCKNIKAKKSDPCAKGGGKKDDPCKNIKAKKADPCAKGGGNKEDPCKNIKAKKSDPCAKGGGKKFDPCKNIKAKKADPCSMGGGKKNDPCKNIKAKKADPCAKGGGKNDDPCKNIKAKKADPCSKGGGKKDDPCKNIKAKKADPCAKGGGKKDDPCKNIKAKKADPCAKGGGKKDDPCKNIKAKKADPCSKGGGKKDDPCKNIKAKKADPCAKGGGKKDDPCKNIKAKKADPCAKGGGKKDDPCKNIKAKKADPCSKGGGKKDDPCKNIKAKKADPCAKGGGKNDDPCKNIKAKKADPCAKGGGKKDDPCKNIKAKKADPCAKGGRRKNDPCAKIVKGIFLESFLLDNRSSNPLRKQYAITTLLTSNSGKFRSLFPSYSKLTVRGLKQLNRNSEIIDKSESKQWRIVNNKIMKENFIRTERNKARIKKGPIMPAPLPRFLLKLIDRARGELTNCIDHMSHCKKNIASQKFNFRKRIDSLRSLMGYDFDRDITSCKYHKKTLKTENENSKQFLLSFRLQQQNEGNTNHSIFDRLEPKPVEHGDICFLLSPTSFQTLFKYFFLDKVNNGNDLSNEIVHIKNKTVSGINSYTLPIINEFRKKSFEFNNRIFKILLKLDSYFRNASNDRSTWKYINSKEAKVSKISPRADFGMKLPEDKMWNAKYRFWKTYDESHKKITEMNQPIPYSKTISFLNVPDKSCCIPLIEALKRKVVKKCNFALISSCWDIDCNEFRIHSFKNEKSLEELERDDNLIQFNKQPSNSQSFNDNISNLDGTSESYIMFEKIGNHIYSFNNLGLLAYWSSNIGNCSNSQFDKISDSQQFNRSLDANADAMNILGSPMNSNGIQFFIDTEKCNRKKQGKKRKLPTCYDPDVESPIDDLYNQGEKYWPFYNECHKRIKDPNTYPPGGDPNANNMLFGHLEVWMMYMNFLYKINQS